MKNTMNIFRIPLVFILLFAIVLLVDLTGGTPNAYLHLIYIPIILAAYYWGIFGGVSVAIIGGILAGPLIQLRITGVAMQNGDFWIARLIILTLVGFVTGYLFMKINKLHAQAKESDLISPLTGTYNTNKLIKDLEEKISNQEKLAIVSIKLTNFEQVSKYIEHKSAKSILNKLVNELSEIYGKDAVYMLGYDEIDLMVSLSCGYLEECKRIIEQYSNALKIDQFMFKISMKIGIYEYDGTAENPIDVYNKARIAYEKVDHQLNGIYFYFLASSRALIKNLTGLEKSALRFQVPYLRQSIIMSFI